MKIEKRGKYYSFRYCINGHQKRVSTKFTEYMKCKVFAENFIAKKHISSVKVEGKFDFDTFLWSDFCSKFMDYSRFTKSAPESDERTIRAINKILSPQYFKDLSTENIRKFITYRREIEKLKDNSVNRDLHSIKSMWKFAITELFEGQKNQASLVKEIATEKITKNKFFTEEEIKIILTKIESPIVLKTMYLMLYLGLRLKEATNLKWEQVLFDKDVVMITPFKTKKTKATQSPVPLNKHLKEFLKKIKDKKGYVVGSDQYTTRKPLLSLSKIISERLKELHIEGTAHTCRHTFISHLIMKGVDGSIVQRWARINKTEILQVYLHLSPKYNNEAINLLPY